MLQLTPVSQMGSRQALRARQRPAHAEPVTLQTPTAVESAKSCLDSMQRALLRPESWERLPAASMETWRKWGGPAETSMIRSVPVPGFLPNRAGGSSHPGPLFFCYRQHRCHWAWILPTRGLVIISVMGGELLIGDPMIQLQLPSLKLS